MEQTSYFVTSESYLFLSGCTAISILEVLYFFTPIPQKAKQNTWSCKSFIMILNAEFQRIARRDKKTFPSDQCKEIEENKEWERLEISSRKLEIPREHFMQRWAR